jgi:hypothetical protein
MPQYEVVKSPGHQYPVGFVFETDALHPVMQQHVKLLRGKKVAAEGAPDTGENEVDEDVGSDFVEDPGEAFDLAAAEYALRAAEAVKPVVKAPAAKAAKVPRAKPATNGPGENS